MTFSSGQLKTSCSAFHPDRKKKPISKRIVEPYVEEKSQSTYFGAQQFWNVRSGPLFLLLLVVGSVIHIPVKTAYWSFHPLYQQQQQQQQQVSELKIIPTSKNSQPACLHMRGILKLAYLEDEEDKEAAVRLFLSLGLVNIWEHLLGINLRE